MLSVKLTGNIPTELKDDAVFKDQAASIQLPQLLFTVRLFLRSYKELGYSPSPELPLLLASIEASMQGQSNTSEFVEAQTQAAPAASILTEMPSVRSDKPQSLQAESVQSGAIQEAVAEEAVTASGTASDSVSMQELVVWWPEVINRVKIDNSPVATLLRNSPVIEVENGRVTVAVKYLFHKEHLDNKKHSQLISEAISAVSGKQLQLRSVIKNNTLEPITSTVDALGDALKVFGGELIE